MIGLPTPNMLRPVNESRLLQAVQFHLPGVRSCSTPPVVPDTGVRRSLDPATLIGVPVATFRAGWFAHIAVFWRRSVPVCLNGREFYRVDETCTGIPVVTRLRIPSEFPRVFWLLAKKGHLDDFPWVELCPSQRAMRIAYAAPD